MMTGCTVCLVLRDQLRPTITRFSASSGVKLTTPLKNLGHCLLTTFFLVNAILKAYSGRCYQSFTPCTERCSSFPPTSLQRRAFMLKHKAKGPRQKLTEWTVPFSPSARWPAARVCAIGWCCASTTEGFTPAAATPPPNPTSRRSVWWQCPVINP